MSENVLTPAQIEESRAMFRKGCRLGVEREDALCDAALRAGEMEADAMRYRWLRERGNSESGASWFYLDGPIVVLSTAETRRFGFVWGKWLDTAIDEARRLLERTPT